MSCVCLALPGLDAEIAGCAPRLSAALARLFDLRPGPALGRAALRFDLGQEGDLLTVAADGQTIHRGHDADAALIALYAFAYTRLVEVSTLLLVHAGTVVRDGHAVVMPAASASGKSTLTAVLLGRGWDAVSDDVAAVDTATCTVLPYPRRMLVRPEALARNPAMGEAFDILGPLAGPGEPVLVAKPRRPPPAGPLPVTGLVFPRWNAGPTVMRRLGGGEAAARLLDQTLNVRHRGAPAVRDAARLVRAVPAWALDMDDPTAAARCLEATPWPS